LAGVEGASNAAAVPGRTYPPGSLSLSRLDPTVRPAQAAAVDVDPGRTCAHDGPGVLYHSPFSSEAGQRVQTGSGPLLTGQSDP